MAPELIIPLVSTSISSAVGAIAFMIANLSKQRTERFKHRETIELDRERLRLVMEAYQRAAAIVQASDLVDLTRALLGSNKPVDCGSGCESTGTKARRGAIQSPIHVARSRRGQTGGGPRFPGTWSYTGDRDAEAVDQMPAGIYLTADAREVERHIASLCRKDPR
jgi:hypothetical protein